MDGNELVLSLAKMKAAKGMTTKDISLASGISMGTLNKIFSGQTADPGISTMTAIVHSMGYTLDDLQIDSKADFENLELVLSIAKLKPHQKNAVRSMINAFLIDASETIGNTVPIDMEDDNDALEAELLRETAKNRTAKPRS